MGVSVFGSVTVREGSFETVSFSNRGQHWPTTPKSTPVLDICQRPNANKKQEHSIRPIKYNSRKKHFFPLIQCISFK